MGQRTKSALIVLSLLGTGSVATDQAAADSVRAIPVNSCQKATPLGVVEYAWNGIYNAEPVTADALNLDCGVPSGPWQSADVTQLWVHVTDLNAWANVSCSMKIVTETGYINYSGGSKKTSGKPGNVDLGWYPLSAHGNAYVACSIPYPTADGKSGLRGLRVDDDG
jgi:hypothetical protein